MDHRTTNFIPVTLSLAAVLIAAMLAPGCGSQKQPAPTSPLTVKIIAFNDFHGHINPPSSHTRVADPKGGATPIELSTGGIEYLSSLVAQLKAQNDRNVVVAAGDLIGGAPLVSSLFHHEPTIEMLSMMGLEFSSVGNHEFDAGRTELLRMQNGGCFAGDARASCRNERFAGARFKYLAANVIDRDTRKPLFPAYGIKDFALPEGRGNFQIAFIGLVVKDTPNLVIPTGVAGLDFTDEADAANAVVPGLRARGIQAIVILIHEGGTTTAKTFDDPSCPGFEGRIKDIVNRLDPAIDMIVSGHTHRSYVCRLGGRLITSASSEGRVLSDIELTIDPATKDVMQATARQLAVVNDTAVNPVPEKYPTLDKDTKLAHLVEFYNSDAAPLAQRKVGSVLSTLLREPTPAGETVLGDLIADAQLAATRGAGAQIAFMNRGGMRADLRADRGYITYNEVFSVHPFGNGLVTLTLTGEQIDALLEQQEWDQDDGVLQVSNGLTYEWSAKAPDGEKVDIARIRLDGKPIDPARGYRVTVNEFLALGGDGFSVLNKASDRVRGVVDSEALEKYIAENSPVKAPAGGRIIQRN